MKPYQHAQAILDGKPMLAVLIAAAEILAERNQLDIALEHKDSKHKLTRDELIERIEDAKIEILAHAETAYCCEQHKGKTFKSARYQIAMVAIKLITDEAFPDISLDMLGDKFSEFKTIL